MGRTKAFFLSILLGAAGSPPGAYAIESPSPEPNEIAQLQFPDPALSNCVQKWARDNINRYQRIAEIQDITCARAGIRSLEGIEQLTELIVIDLSSNPVEDYSPLGRISRSLRFVWLWGNSLSPAEFLDLRRLLPQAWIGGWSENPPSGAGTSPSPTTPSSPSPTPPSSPSPNTPPSPVPPASGPVPPPFPPSSEPLPSDEGSNVGLTGKEVYLKECAVCHGKEGEGTARGYQVKFPVSTYATAVTRIGRSGNREFDIPMPGYSPEKISDKQLQEMWEYLRSFPHPTKGKELFTAYCANCHGQDGRGGFSGEGILGETDEYRKYIRRGKNLRYPLNRKKYMPAYTETELSTSDILLLRQYARELRQTPRQPRPEPSPGQLPRPAPHEEDRTDKDRHKKKPCHCEKDKNDEDEDEDED